MKTNIPTEIRRKKALREAQDIFDGYDIKFAEGGAVRPMGSMGNMPTDNDEDPNKPSYMDLIRKYTTAGPEKYNAYAPTSGKQLVARKASELQRQYQQKENQLTNQYKDYLSPAQLQQGYKSLNDYNTLQNQYNQMQSVKPQPVQQYVAPQPTQTYPPFAPTDSTPSKLDKYRQGFLRNTAGAVAQQLVGKYPQATLAERLNIIAHDPLNYINTANSPEDVHFLKQLALYHKG